MDTSELLQAKRRLEERLNSLDNDAKRAFFPIEGTAFAPFPIAMYAFATIDYFSSFWAGWNDIAKRPSVDTRTQTKKMADFLEKYLLYPQKESQLAISIWRHKLMHTGQPRILQENAKRHGWRITDRAPDHWRLNQIEPDEYILSIGIFDLAQDLRVGVFGPNGYFEKLRYDTILQSQWQKFKQEIENYTFALKI